jgi:hypothetical protein
LQYWFSLNAALIYRNYLAAFVHFNLTQNAGNAAMNSLQYRKITFQKIKKRLWENFKN